MQVDIKVVLGKKRKKIEPSLRWLYFIKLAFVCTKTQMSLALFILNYKQWRSLTGKLVLQKSNLSLCSNFWRIMSKNLIWFLTVFVRHAQLLISPLSSLDVFIPSGLLDGYSWKLKIFGLKCSKVASDSWWLSWVSCILTWNSLDVIFNKLWTITKPGGLSTSIQHTTQYLAVSQIHHQDTEKTEVIAKFCSRIFIHQVRLQVVTSLLLQYPQLPTLCWSVLGRLAWK